MEVHSRLRDCIAVLKDEAKGSTVDKAQLSAVEVDEVLCETQQAGNTVSRARLIDLSDDGQHKAGCQPVQRTYLLYSNSV